MPTVAKRALQALAMFAIVFAIAFATRIPAMRIGVAYAMHGFFAAPLYALAVVLCRRLAGSAVPAVVGGIAVACVLGAMSPVMALGNALPALGCLVAVLCLRGASKERQTLVPGFVWGALCYPCTVLGGVVFGSYYVVSGNVLVDILLGVLAIALSYVVALLAASVGRSKA